MKKIKQALKTKYHERQDVIDGALTALVAKEHILLLGPAGTAKSDFSRDITHVISGFKYFGWLLTKFTSPEELFGPPSFAALQKDEYKRVLTNKLPEANIAFLDEIFKANSSILNSLLTALNERKFFNHTDELDIPLNTCIGASNELPENNSLDALYDRFLFRYWVKYITSSDLLKDLLKNGNSVVIPSITIDELKVLQALVPKVDIPDYMYDLLLEIKFKLTDESIIASDRRWVKVIKLLKSHAVIENRDQVQKSDFNILKDVLWKEPNQRKHIIEILGTLVNPEAIKAIKIMDASVELYNQLPSETSGLKKSDLVAKYTEALPQFEEQLEKLYELMKANSDCPELIEATAKVTEFKDNLAQKAARLLNLVK